MGNIIKLILNVIIMPYQSAFILGRLITDNIILAFESLHTSNKNLSIKKGFVRLKFDIGKAYDRLEWDFINNTLSSMMHHL